MTFPKLCRDCKWSQERESYSELYCFNPHVNASDAWALSSKEMHAGTHCHSERSRSFLDGFSECGKRGARWEAK